jgi:hypothetical protein
MRLPESETFGQRVRLAASKRAALLACVGATAASCGLLDNPGAQGASSKPRILGYEAYIVANPQAGGCYGKVGLYVGLQAGVSARVPRADLKRLVALDQPKAARLIVRGASYALSVDAHNSGYGNLQVGWNFLLVDTNTRTTQRLIGAIARIRYTRHHKRAVTKRARVIDGRCKSLI